LQEIDIARSRELIMKGALLSRIVRMGDVE